MVLTEQDYISFLLNMNNLDRNLVIPHRRIRESLASSAQLFVGYGLNDSNCRMVFTSISNSLAKVEPPLSIAIMSTPDFLSNSAQSIDQALKYLESYTKNVFKSNVYWSDLFMFIVELRNRFETFKKKNSILS
jgi:SIR2-like domain